MPKKRKYSDIVNVAQNLFWKHGIRRVTIEEICREANVSKMTFYRYFPNKNELAKTVLKNILDDSVKQYRKLMNEDIPFEEKIKKQLMLKFEGTREISQELVKDIYTDNSIGLRDYWEKWTRVFTNEVLENFKHAQKMGWMRKDINLDFILFFNAKMAEMISDPKMVALYGNTQELIMEVANLFFYGIFPREKK